MKDKFSFQIFQGNNDAISAMRHNLANQIETSYVRIIPITWNKNICMRISLLGCKAGKNLHIITTCDSSSVEKHAYI